MTFARNLFLGAMALLAIGFADSSVDAVEPGGSVLPENVTFSEHVAPLIFNNCYECHRPGEAAPFTLMTYQDVSKRATMLEEVIQRRFMPPWHPATGDVEFRYSRRLSDEQLDLFAKWVATGKQEGDLKKMPELPSFGDGWRLGKPDLTVVMANGRPSVGPRR